MSFDDLMAALNDCIMRTCGGEEFVFSRVTSLTEPPADDPATITGILESGAELEGLPPGDDSAYAQFSMDENEVSVPFSKGDEIETASTVYTIVDIKADKGGMVKFLLRKDRAVT